ncbi:MAG: bifunctional UDP-N-acetylmuramoyl-tripeptide:D-alanyl-D-alanine ligase/alanine racemase [Bacteroidetes bacterium]|nr:bifunctional UDP-N-acetylmuramoyl-tripeptide:D-alanyl-D-alanine ligase/alanine racemase [Bacteroidota bacterium]
MSMNFTLSYFLERINSKIFGSKREDFIVKNLLFDSRKLNIIDGTVFFAIKTLSDNGQKYIAELYFSGVRVFVTENLPQEYEKYEDATFILVESTIGAMQEFARLKRELFKTPIIAITGSNGKTIVKEWIVQLIGNNLKVCQSPRSYNSQIGVALSLWNLTKDDNLGVIEAGISNKGEMQTLERIIKPQIGIFTNIGDAHQIYFNSIEEKIEEKLILFKDSKTIIYCMDNIQVHNIIQNKLKGSNKEILTWGKNENAVLRILKVGKQKSNSIIHYIYKGEESLFTIPFTDRASIENAINAFAACLTLNINLETLQERTPCLQSLEMRLEIKEGINQNLIINDSYSSDLMSLSLALDFINQQKDYSQKTAILSDITQSFNLKEELYKEINRLLIDRKINTLVGIGEDFIQYKSLLTINNRVFPTTQDFLKEFSLKDFNNQIILIKGARSFEFERISRLFEKKTHQTVLEINLSSLAHNVNYFKKKLKENVKLMAMVKAHSYGSGSYEIAKSLSKQHTDYLTVAFADEGVELRHNDIKLPIMVMSAQSKDLNKLLHYNLEPEIYSLSILKEFIDQKRQYEIIGNSQQLNIHIKLDTGMHRLGMEEKDIEPLIKLLKENPTIRIKSIFSHLAGADNHLFDDFTKKQINTFEALSQQITKAFPYKILRHIANSAAINRFPEAQFDMVRLGIGMYGIGDSAAQEQELEYVHSLKTHLILKREIEENETVGYSRAFVAKKKMTIGVIPIGYADGLSRQRGNGRGRVWINGNLVPIIGNVCMDMCMLDLSGVECKENDMVIIFSKEYPIWNISNELNTIPYEILSTISQRVKRVFYQE